MSTVEKVIEFETVKKGRNIILFALIGVLALSSIGFMLAWILKPKGTTVGVSNIEIQSDLLSVGEGSDKTYIASAGASYMVSAFVEVIGGVESTVEWDVMPTGSIEIDTEKTGKDGEIANKHNLYFKISNKVDVSKPVTIIARSSYNKSVLKEFKFQAKIGYAADGTVSKVTSNSKNFSLNSSEGRQDITLPFFDSTQLNALILNTYDFKVEQLGELSSSGERAVISRGMNDGTSDKNVENIEYELTDVSPAGSIIFDTTAGNQGSAPNTVYNRNDSVPLVMKKAGTATLKITLNKYNAGEDIVRFVDITSKSSLEYNTFLSSISFKPNTNYELFINPLGYLDIASSLVFSPEKPAGGDSWITSAVEVYESDEYGERKSNANRILTISNRTQIRPTEKAGRTFITVKDNSSSGFQVSATKEINVYAAVSAVTIDIANANASKNQIQQGDSIKATAKYTISNSADSVLNATNVRATILFTYSTAEPVVGGLINEFTNYAETVIFKGMYYTGVNDSIGNKIFAVDVNGDTIDAENRLKFTSGYRSASATLVGTVGAQAEVSSLSLSFMLYSQTTGNDDYVKFSTRKIDIAKTVTDVLFKDMDDDNIMLITQTRDIRYVKFNDGTEKVYIYKPTSTTTGGYSDISILSFIKFKNAKGDIWEDTVLPDGVTLTIPEHISQSFLNSSYKIYNYANETTVPITLTIKYTGDSGNTVTVTKVINLVYKKTVSSLLLNAQSTVRTVNYDAAGTVAGVSTNNNAVTGDKLTASFINVTTSAAYNLSDTDINIFVNGTMLYKKSESNNNTYFYLNSAAASNTANALFYMKSASQIFVCKDLFDLSFTRYLADEANWDGNVFDSFEIAYSLLPLVYNEGAAPSVQSVVKGDFYHDYTYDKLKKEGLIVFASYDAVRQFDAVAFYEDENYSNTISNRTASLGIQFTVFPSGIFNYGSGQNIAAKNLNSAIANKLNLQKLSKVVASEQLSEAISANSFIATSAGTATVKIIETNVNATLNINIYNDILAIQSLEYYTIFSKTGDNYVSDSNSIINNNAVLQLINNDAVYNTFSILVKVTYEELSANHVSLAQLLPRFKLPYGTEYTEYSFDNAQTNRFFNFAWESDLKTALSIGGSTIGENPVRYVVFTLSVNGSNGTNAFELGSSYNAAGFTSSKMSIVSSTTADRIIFSETEGGTTHASSTTVTMTADGNGNLVNATKELYMGLGVDAPYALSAEISTEIKGNYSAIQSAIQIIDLDNGNDELTNNDDIVVTFDGNGKLTIKSLGKSYKSLKITVTATYTLFNRAFDNGASVMPSKNKTYNLTNDIYVEIKTDAKVIDFVDGSNNKITELAILTSGSDTGKAKSFVDANINMGLDDLSNLTHETIAYTFEDNGGQIFDSNKKHYYEFAGLDYDPINNIVSMDNDAPRPYDVAGNKSIEVNLVATWTSSSGKTVVKKIALKIATINVDVYFRAYNKDAHTYTSSNDGIDKELNITKYNNNSIDFDVIYYNSWTKAEVITTPSGTIYSADYDLTVDAAYNTSITQDGTDPNIVNFNGGFSSATVFEFKATVSISFNPSLNLGDNDIDHKMSVLATVTMYDRISDIRVINSTPGLTDVSGDIYTLILVKGFGVNTSFNLNSYIDLISDLTGNVDESATFTLAHDDTESDAISLADAKNCVNIGLDGKIADNYLKALSSTPAGEYVYLKIIAVSNTGDLGAPLVEKYLKIRVYEPTLTLTGTKSYGSDTVGSDLVYMANVASVNPELIFDFGVTPQGISTVDSAYTKITISNNENNKFSSSKSNVDNIFTFNIGISKNVITSADITSESSIDVNRIFTVTAITKIDGVEFTKTVKFCMISKLENEYFNDLKLALYEGNSKKVGNSFTIEVGNVAVLPELKVNIVDTSKFINALLGAYSGSSYVTLSYGLVHVSDLTGASINSSTGVITNFSAAAEFEIYAILNIFGSSYDTRTLFASPDDKISIEITNQSLLQTKLYEGLEGGTFAAATEVSNLNNIDVSYGTKFDGTTTSRKVIYVVVDYSNTNLNSVFAALNITTAFKPFLTGNIVPYKKDGTNHLVGIDTTKKLIYAGYLVNGTGSVSAGGYVQTASEAKTSPSINATFTAYSIVGGDFYFPNNITLNANDNSGSNSHISSGNKSGIKEEAFTAGFRGDYSVAFDINGNSYTSGTPSLDLSFAKIDFDINNGTFKVTSKTTEAGGTATLYITVTVTSGINKGEKSINAVIITVNPAIKPTFTSITGEVERESSIVILDTSKLADLNAANNTEASLIRFTRDSSDVNFAYNVTNVILLTGGGTLSKNSGTWEFTAPNYALTSRFNVLISITDGYYKGTNTTVEVVVYTVVRVTIREIDGKNYATTNTHLNMIAQFDDLLYNTVSPSITIDVYGDPLGYVLSGSLVKVGAYYNYSFKYNINPNGVGGKIKLRAAVKVNETGYYFGKTIYSDYIEIDILSLSLKNVAEVDGNKILSNVITLKPGGTIDINRNLVDKRIGTGSVTVSGSDTYYKVELINSNVTAGKLSMDSVFTNRLMADSGANFTGANILYSNAIMITVTASDGKTYINFFDVVITNLTKPAPGVDILYERLDGQINLTDAEYTTPAIYVGESITFSITDISAYSVNDVKFSISGYGNGTISVDKEAKTATFTASEHSSGNNIKMTVYAIIYGEDYELIKDFEFEIRPVASSGILLSKDYNYIAVSTETKEYMITVTVLKDPIIFGASGYASSVEFEVGYSTSYISKVILLLKENGGEFNEVKTSTDGKLIYKGALHLNSELRIEAVSNKEMTITGEGVSTSLDITVRYIKSTETEIDGTPTDNYYNHIFKSQIGFGIIEIDKETFTVAVSKNKLFYSEQAMFSVSAQKISTYTVTYEISGAQAGYAEFYNNDKYLRIKDEYKNTNGKIEITVTPKIEAAGGIVITHDAIVITFYPDLTAGYSAADGVYSINFDVDKYDFNSSDVTYEANIISGNGDIGEFIGGQNGNNSNGFTYVPYKPDGGTFTVEFTVRLSNADDFSSIYKGASYSFTRTITIAPLSVPTLAVTTNTDGIASSNYVNIVTTLVSPQGLDLEFEGNVSYAYVDENGNIDLVGKGLLVLPSNASNVEVFEGYSVFAAKNATLKGGYQRVRVTVVLSNNNVNGVYKNKTYSYDIEVKVEGLDLSATVSDNNGADVNGEIIPSVNSVYNDLGFNFTYTLDSAPETQILYLDSSTGEFTKLFGNGGFQKVKVSIDETAFECFVDVFVPMAVIDEGVVIINAKSGTVTPSLLGIYAGVGSFEITWPLEVEKYLDITEVKSGEVVTHYTYSKKPTKLGGNQTLTIIFTDEHGYTVTKDIKIYVEPIVLSASYTANSTNGGYTGTINASLGSVYDDLNANEFSATVLSGALNINNSTKVYTKKLNNAVSVAEIEISYVSGTDTIKAYIFIAIEKTESTIDPISSGTRSGDIKAYLGGIYSGVADMAATADVSYLTLAKVNKSGDTPAYYTFTKVPTQDGGYKTVTITYSDTFGGTATTTATIYVEPLNILAASDVNETVVTLSASPISVYASGGNAVTFTNITYALENAKNPAIVEQVGASNVFTKLVGKGGTQKIKVSGEYNGDTYTDYIDIVVEPTEIDETITGADGLNGTIFVELAGIYKSKLQSFSIDYVGNSDRLISIAPVTATGDIAAHYTFNKLATLNGGTAKLLITAVGADGGTVTKEIEIDVQPMALDIDVPDTNASNGTITVTLGDFTLDTDDIVVMLNGSSVVLNNDFIKITNNGNGTITFTKKINSTASLQVVEISVTVDGKAYNYPIYIQTSAASIDLTLNPENTSGELDGVINVALSGYDGTVTMSEDYDTDYLDLVPAEGETPAYYTFTKLPTKDGGYKTVTVTFTDSLGNEISESVTIYVEPLQLLASSQESGGTVTISADITDMYKNGGNVPTFTNMTYEFENAKNPAIVKQDDIDANKFIKLLGKGGTQKIKVSGEYNGETYTDYIDIDVDPTEIAETINGADGLNGTIFVALNGLDESELKSFTVDYVGNADKLILITLVPAAEGTAAHYTFKKLATLNGGTAKLLITAVVGENNETITKEITIDVEPMDLSVTYDDLDAYTGDITVSLGAPFGNAATVQVKLNGSSVNLENDFIKITNNGDGTITFTKKFASMVSFQVVEVSVTVDGRTYFYPVYINTTPATIQTTVTLEVTDGEYSGTITAELNGIFEDVGSYTIDYVGDASDYLTIDPIMDDETGTIIVGYTFTKKPTVSGGPASLIVTFTDAVSGSISTTITIDVEALDLTANYVLDVDGLTGEITVDVDTVFSGLLSGYTFVYELVGENTLLELNSDGTFTKLLSDKDDTQQVRVSIDGTNFECFVDVDVEAAELDGVILIENVDGESYNGKITIPALKGIYAGVVDNITVNYVARTGGEDPDYDASTLITVFEPNEGETFFTYMFANIEEDAVAELEVTFTDGKGGSVTFLISINVPGNGTTI